MLEFIIADYIFALTGAFVLVVFLTFIIKRLALAWGILDDPLLNPSKKKHTHPIPLLGGLGIGIAFLVLINSYFFGAGLRGAGILPKHIVAITLAVVLIMIGGCLDDKYNLRASKQLFFPILAVLVIIAGGIGIDFISNPFGGILNLDLWNIEIFKWYGNIYKISLPADLITFAWLLGIMYATSIFDALDGLVTGIGVIGGVVLFFLSLMINLPLVALVAAVFVGSQLGFLVFNFYPAGIFLGESGALFIGFMLGVLAILGSAKVATAFLVMGLPVLDMVWLVFKRVIIEKKSPAIADRTHLPHRFLKAGFSPRQSVLIMYLFSISFGVSALFLQNKGKLIAMVILAVSMLCLGAILYWRFKKLKIKK